MGSIGAFGIFFQTEKLRWEIRKRHLRDILIFRYKLSLFGFRQKSEKNRFGIAEMSQRLKLHSEKCTFSHKTSLFLVSFARKPHKFPIYRLVAIESLYQKT